MVSPMAEPIYDVAHLAHIELLTPKPDESLWFFTHVLSLQEVERHGQSVYLRAYGDYQRYSLKLTESKQGWPRSRRLSHDQRRRARPPRGGDPDHRICARLDRGRCRARYRAFQFTSPDGHAFEIFYEIDHFVPAEAERPYLKKPATTAPRKRRARA